MSETTAPAATREFVTVYNGRTSFYDIHAAGCQHLNLFGQVYGRYAGYEVMNGTYAAADAKAVKAEFEGGNEGCLVGKISPCAK